MTLPSRPAALVRISDARADATGTTDEAGVRRQEADAKDLAKQRGWPVPAVYTENDTSAFKRRTVTLPDGSKAQRTFRPVFRQLLADLTSGAVDGLIAYDLDRVARDPRDLEDLVDVIQDRKVPVLSVTGSLDLSTDSGITMARILTALNNKSSRDTGRRVARKHEELAEKGLPGGGGLRNYGYDSRMVLDPTEAEVVKRIAQAVIDGKSLNSIRVDLNNDGIPAALGGQWSARSVHSVVSKPAVAGLRSFRGEVVGKATWEPILSEETWGQVKASLAERAKGSGNTFVHWCRGVLVCYRCGHGLTSSNVSGGSYWCATPLGGCGAVRISRDHTHRVVQKLTLAFLSRPGSLESMRQASSSDQASAVRDSVRADEAQLQELSTLWAQKAITTAEWVTARREIEKRLADSRQIVSASLPGAVRVLLTGSQIEASWEALSPVEKRSVVQAVFPSGIEVHPRTPGTKPGTFDPSRLRPA